jgi:hypothetical protein
MGATFNDFFDYHGVKFLKVGVGISTISYNWIKYESIFNPII